MALLINNVSVLRHNIYFPLACFIAKLFAAPKPALTGFLIILTFGNSFSIASIDPSCELLSITKISNFISCVFSMTDFMAFIVKSLVL